MFLSFKFTNTRVAAVIIGVIAVLIVTFSVKSKELYATNNEYLYNNAADVSQYLQSFGLKIGEVNSQEIILPYEFGEVYENYNKIQQSQGFDLSDYKGKSVTRYFCEVFNHPEKQNDVFAEVLVFEGKIIGADVYSTDLSGFMVGLK